MPTSPGTSNARENTEWPVTGLAIISCTAGTHRGRLLVRSSVKADLRRKNNSLLNLHHIERRSFFVVTVILGTNLPMTPFTLRGLAKVHGEWNLVCLALNIKRMGTLATC